MDYNAFIQGQVELHDPEDECATIPQNAVNPPLSDSVSYSRRLDFWHHLCENLKSRGLIKI